VVPWVASPTMYTCLPEHTNTPLCSNDCRDHQRKT
jgi:hypothetical protein